MKDDSAGATFAQVFEDLRLQRGWSPAEVARRLAVYPSEVSRWRKGGGINITNVWKVADLFGVERATLERLAGLGDSNVGSEGPTLPPQTEAELQSYAAWYRTLVEKRVPRSMWAAYTAACDALADAFGVAGAAAVNTDAPEPANSPVPPSRKRRRGPDEDVDGPLTKV